MESGKNTWALVLTRIKFLSALRIAPDLGPRPRSFWLSAYIVQKYNFILLEFHYIFESKNFPSACAEFPQKEAAKGRLLPDFPGIPDIPGIPETKVRDYTVSFTI